MKRTTYKWIGGFVSCAMLVGAIIGVRYATAENKPEQLKVAVQEPIVSHRQATWISALEWCESNGNPEAVNLKDKDGTPSYYSFQFKPETFRYYGEMYSVIEKKLTNEKIMELMKSNEIQREIVEHMVLDKAVNFRQQFPACTKKLGLPPVN